MRVSRQEIQDFLKIQPVAVSGVIIAFAFVVLMLIGSWIAPFNPETTSHGAALSPPSSSHIFGTDRVGADVFSRVIAAPRTDVFIAIAATTFAMAIGIPTGLLAGFFSTRGARKAARVVAEIVMRGVDVLQAFPVFALAMVLVAIRGPSVANVVFAVAFVNIPIFVRLVRSEVLRLRNSSFVEASRCCGTGEFTIAIKEVLPNALGPAMTQASVTMGFAILLTAGLSFVGAGVRSPTPEWGLMVSLGAQDMLNGFWWTALFPGLFLGAAVFGFALLGDAVRSFVDWRRTRS